MLSAVQETYLSLHLFTPAPCVDTRSVIGDFVDRSLERSGLSAEDERCSLPQRPFTSFLQPSGCSTRLQAMGDMLNSVRSSSGPPARRGSLPFLGQPTPPGSPLSLPSISSSIGPASRRVSSTLSDGPALTEGSRSASRLDTLKSLRRRELPSAPQSTSGSAPNDASNPGRAIYTPGRARSDRNSGEPPRLAP